MSTQKPKPPNLQKLKGGYVLGDTLRASCNLSKDILTNNAKNWSDIKNVVDNYLSNADMWEATGQDFLTLLQSSFQQIENHIERKTLPELTTTDMLLCKYVSSLQSFYSNKRIVENVKTYYRKKELDKRVDKNKSESHLQATSSASALIIQKGRQIEIEALESMIDEEESSSSMANNRKRKEREYNQSDGFESYSVELEPSLFDSPDPFNINPEVEKSQYAFVKNGKRFDFHIPSKNLISPKKPALDKNDLGDLKDLFDIRLSSDSTPNCASDTEACYQLYRQEQDRNKHIKEEPDAIKFLSDVLKDGAFLNTKALWNASGEGRFIDFMKHVLTDYYQSCRRAVPININLERSFYCEIIIPIFKHFGVMVGNLSGSWCEKQLLESKRVWLPLKDFRVSGINRKLLDGIMTNERETILVAVESSGSEDNTVHNVEDTYKQLKSTSDFLKYLLAKYKMASVNTMKKVEIPCVSVIGDCLTFCITSIHNKSKWKFVEARTCTIPTTESMKKQWLKVFEFMAFLNHVIEKSLRTIDCLEDESLGYEELDSEAVFVKDYFV